MINKVIPHAYVKSYDAGQSSPLLGTTLKYQQLSSHTRFKPDWQQTTSGSVNFPKGSACYVAVQAYNSKCLRGYSNIRQVVIE